jgi:hypothetical protein
VNDELKRLFVTIFELYRKRYEKKNHDVYEMLSVQKAKREIGRS